MRSYIIEVGFARCVAARRGLRRWRVAFAKWRTQGQRRTFVVARSRGSKRPLGLPLSGRLMTDNVFMRARVIEKRVQYQQAVDGWDSIECYHWDDYDHQAEAENGCERVYLNDCAIESMNDCWEAEQESLQLDKEQAEEEAMAFLRFIDETIARRSE